MEPTLPTNLTVAPPPYVRTYYPTNAERTDDRKYYCCFTPSKYRTYEAKIRATRKQISLPCCPVPTAPPAPPAPPPAPTHPLILLPRDWEPMGDLSNVYVSSFARDGGILYAGGEEYPNGPIVLSYSGGAWTPLSISGMIGNALTSVAVGANGVVYAGGYIFVGEDTLPYVLSYDALAGVWTNLSGGDMGTIPSGSIRAMATGPNGVVYAAGDGNRYPVVMSYNSVTQQWTSLSGGSIYSSRGRIDSITIDSLGTIYAGGSSDLNLIFVYRYTDTWTDIGYGGEMFSMAITLNTIILGPNQTIYAGGTYGPFPYYPYGMCLSGQVWTTLYDISIDPRDGSIVALQYEHGILYAAGNTNSGFIPFILQYDGNGWIFLPNSFSERVSALIFDYSGAILAGGGGYIASYQPLTITWTSPGQGLTFNVYSILPPAEPTRVLTGLTNTYANLTNFVAQTPVQFYVTSVSSVTGLESVPSDILTYS